MKGNPKISIIIPVYNIEGYGHQREQVLWKLLDNAYLLSGSSSGLPNGNLRVKGYEAVL